jgi:hypothetical protein
LRKYLEYFEEKTVIFMLSNGRESGEGIEERNSQQNEG